MPRQQLDSYTGDPYVEEYRSPFKGINEPRSLFKPRTFRRVIWRAERIEGDNWELARIEFDRHTGEPSETRGQLLEGSERRAKAVLDFYALNDTRFRLAYAAFVDGDMEPIIRLATKAQEVGDATV